MNSMSLAKENEKEKEKEKERDKIEERDIEGDKEEDKKEKEEERDIERDIVWPPGTELSRTHERRKTRPFFSQNLIKFC